MTLIVLCAGASASGKTTFAKMLNHSLEASGIPTYLISMDNYYKPRNKMPESANFDLPIAFDLDLLRAHVAEIRKQKIIEIPQFSFKIKDRLPETITFDSKDTQVVIIEGIHAMTDISSYKLEDNQKYAIFVETDSYLNYLTRRILRDEKSVEDGGRNTTEEVTRERELYSGVRDAFCEHIAPVKRYADCQISNNAEGDLEEALKLVSAEIKGRLKIADTKFSYSVKDRITHFSSAAQDPKNRDVEIIERAHSFDELFARFGNGGF